MPVLAVNSLGVNAAMSFICGLSTMATLIEPPFPPLAGVPLDPEAPPELELSEPPPPQPTASTTTPANRAAAAQKRRALICPLLLLQRGGWEPSATDLTYSVGLCWLSSQLDGI